MPLFATTGLSASPSGWDNTRFSDLTDSIGRIPEETQIIWSTLRRVLNGAIGFRSCRVSVGVMSICSESVFRAHLISRYMYQWLSFHTVLPTRIDRGEWTVFSRKAKTISLLTTVLSAIEKVNQFVSRYLLCPTESSKGETIRFQSSDMSNMRYNKRSVVR